MKVRLYIRGVYWATWEVTEMVIYCGLYVKIPKPIEMKMYSSGDPIMDDLRTVRFLCDLQDPDVMFCDDPIALKLLEERTP